MDFVRKQKLIEKEDNAWRKKMDEETFEYEGIRRLIINKFPIEKPKYVTTVGYVNGKKRYMIFNIDEKRKLCKKTECKYISTRIKTK